MTEFVKVKFLFTIQQTQISKYNQNKNPKHKINKNINLNCRMCMCNYLNICQMQGILKKTNLFSMNLISKREFGSSHLKIKETRRGRKQEGNLRICYTAYRIT